MKKSFVFLLITLLVILVIVLLWFFRERWQGNTNADKYRLANRLVIVMDKGGEIWWIDPDNYQRLSLHTNSVTWADGLAAWQARAAKTCEPAKENILWSCGGRTSWRFQDQIYIFSNEREFIQLVQKKSYGINVKTLQNIPAAEYGAQK